jgi:hypothetical protein
VERLRESASVFKILLENASARWQLPRDVRAVAVGVAAAAAHDADDADGMMLYVLVLLPALALPFSRYKRRQESGSNNKLRHGAWKSPSKRTSSH